MDLHSHYIAQSNASFWTRPKNAAMSREVNSHHLSRLNEKYRLNAKCKAEAARRILYDGGFSYEGITPKGALNGDPQFTSFYDSGAITAYRVMMDHLEQDVKGRGYDCTGRRYMSLYLQALAGNKAARKTLDIAYHGDFPSHPREAWLASEEIMHEVYDDYLKHYGCPDRLCTHPMYPDISPPLPNPIKLRGFIMRARKARDIDTLSWMLGRDIEPNELQVENTKRLIYSVLNRFEYSAAEIAVMDKIVQEQENKRKRDMVVHPDNDARAAKKPGSFLLGCFMLFAFFALGYGGLSFAGYLIGSRSTIGNIIGTLLLPGVLVFFIVLCKVFRGKKGRPP